MNFTVLTQPGSPTAAPTYGTGSATWGYDFGGRLTSESWSGSGVSTVTFAHSYDPAGNLTTIRGYGVTPDIGSDQIASTLIPGYISQTYDTTGEVVQFNGNTAKYDPLGELTTLTGRTTNETTLVSSTFSDAMVYDHLGRRASLVESISGGISSNNRRGVNAVGSVPGQSDVQSFVYDGGDLIYRQFPWNSATGYPLTVLNQPDFQTDDNCMLYLYGPTGLVAEFDRFGYNSRTLIFDPQGSFVSSSNGAYVQQNNGIMEGTSAFPSGRPPPPNASPAVQNLATSQPFQYKGQYGYYTDGASGLIYCQHRYYDPNTGRWTERDPTGLDGGVNVYSYCDGNAVLLIDPYGLEDGPMFEFTWQGVFDGLETSAAAAGHVA